MNFVAIIENILWNKTANKYKNLIAIPSSPFLRLKFLPSDLKPLSLISAFHFQVITQLKWHFVLHCFSSFFKCYVLLRCWQSYLSKAFFPLMSWNCQESFLVAFSMDWNWLFSFSYTGWLTKTRLPNLTYSLDGVLSVTISFFLKGFHGEWILQPQLEFEFCLLIPFLCTHHSHIF